MRYFAYKQKLNLLRSLALRTSPAYIQYYVTARCDLDCEQCNINYAHADREEMNIDQIRVMARNLAEIGTCIVLLIGGEPFVRKDLPEIVQAFTDVNIHVRLQTNGLATKKQLIRCVAAGAHDISISLDSLAPTVQDIINGGCAHSWERTIRAIATVNEVFPENGTGFFGMVLMPRNIGHIVDVVEFATQIGWGVSLVPLHSSPPNQPRGFRILEDEGPFHFCENMHPLVRRVIDQVDRMGEVGFNVYDSGEYLEDIYRFVIGEPVRWRRRNGNVCDSPNLYFAIEPNGDVSPCCDYKLVNHHPAWHKDFPQWYRNGIIHREVYSFTQHCGGCMYGSYPEVTITARYLKPLIKRLFFFGRKRPTLRKLSTEDLKEIALKICVKNSTEREVMDRVFFDTYRSH